MLKKCKWCGKEYRGKPSSKFCCRMCFQEWMKQEWTKYVEFEFEGHVVGDVAVPFSEKGIPVREKDSNG